MGEGTKIGNVQGIEPAENKLIHEIDVVDRFIGTICSPLADEIGVTLRDNMKAYRTDNLFKIVEKAQAELLPELNGTIVSVHPRIVHEVIENGSLCDDHNLQNMWAGLLASSATGDRPSDSNILYTNILRNLTTIQAKVINHVCNVCKVNLFNGTFIYGTSVMLTSEELIEITGTTDFHQIDAEIDSLRAQELIGTSNGDGGGFDVDSAEMVADIIPAGLLLALYAKTRGIRTNVIDFYHDRIMHLPDEIDPETWLGTS